MRFQPPNYSDKNTFLAPKLGPWSAFIWMHRKPILDAVKEAAPKLTGKLLDVGCGNKPYAPVLKCDQHLGVDVATSPHDHDRFDFTFDGLNLPFDNESFDSVLCSEVLEHCKDPLRLAGEIGRVMKPGAHALITVPFVYHHHEEPHDYQRLTRYGMEELSRRAGCEVIWLRPRGGVLWFWVAANITAYSRRWNRRPLSDMKHWLFFPLHWLLIRLDKSPQPAISLGWQMLMRKDSNDR